MIHYRICKKYYFKHFEIFPQIQNFNFFEYFMLRYLHEFNTLIIFILIWNDFSKFRRLEYSCRFLCDAFERRIRKSRQCCGTPAPLASNRNRFFFEVSCEKSYICLIWYSWQCLYTVGQIIVDVTCINIF